MWISILNNYISSGTGWEYHDLSHSVVGIARNGHSFARMTSFKRMHALILRAV